MTKLEAAIEAAEARKAAALGDESVGFVTGDNAQSRAIFSGFDLDHDELTELASRIAVYYHASVHEGMMGIRPLFSSAWIEGLLVGLMVNTLPDAQPQQEGPTGL